MEISPKRTLNFDDTEIAFRSKSNAELNAAYLLFKVISSKNLFVKGGPADNQLLTECRATNSTCNQSHHLQAVLWW